MAKIAIFGRHLTLASITAGPSGVINITTVEYCTVEAKMTDTKHRAASLLQQQSFLIFGADFRFLVRVSWALEPG